MIVIGVVYPTRRGFCVGVTNAHSDSSGIEAQECAHTQHYTRDKQARNAAGLILTVKLQLFLVSPLPCLDYS